MATKSISSNAFIINPNEMIVFSNANVLGVEKYTISSGGVVGESQGSERGLNVVFDGYNLLVVKFSVEMT